MPGPLEFALVALFSVAWPLYTQFVTWPRYLARFRAGVPGARLGLYRLTLAEQWGLAAAVVLLWVRAGRPWAALGLRAAEGWRAWLAYGLVAAITLLFAQQLRKVAALPAVRERLRPRLQALDPMLPHSPAEFRTFLALSVTAGICEELLFRGMFIWTLQPWIGTWGAGILGAILFGVAHSYQGRDGAIRAGVGGVVMTAVYLVSGSLIPGMVLHAIVDIGSGGTAWLALRDETPKPVVATA